MFTLDGVTHTRCIFADEDIELMKLKIEELPLIQTVDISFDTLHSTSISRVYLVTGFNGDVPQLNYYSATKCPSTNNLFNIYTDTITQGKS